MTAHAGRVSAHPTRYPPHPLPRCPRQGSARDEWSDERFFDDLLKSCRRDLEHGGDHVAALLVEAAVEVSFKTQHYALVLGG